MLSLAHGCHAEHDESYKNDKSVLEECGFHVMTSNCRPQRNGPLYGTTVYGGNGPCKNRYLAGCGVVFELTPNANGGWSYKIVYNGKPYPGAKRPWGQLAFDQAGNIYLLCDGEHGGNSAGNCERNRLT